MERTYEVVLEPAEEGGFAVYVPGMSGCVFSGRNGGGGVGEYQRCYRVLA